MSLTVCERRRLTAADNPSGLRATATLILALLCCSCAGRPLQGVLVPTAESAEGASRVPILIATTRQPATGDAGEMFNSERASTISYAQIAVSIPPARKIGEIQWPASPPGDPHRHFVTASTEYLDKPGFSAALAAVAKTTRRNKAMIFVHGFNNRFDDAAYRLAQIVQDSRAPVIPVLFSWPSRGVVGLSAYVYDRESADQSRDSLQQLIDTVALSPNVREVTLLYVREVTLLCHSMGCLLTLDALLSRSMRAGQIGGKVKNVLLVAPDRGCQYLSPGHATNRRSSTSFCIVLVARRSRAQVIQVVMGRRDSARRYQSRRGALQNRFAAREDPRIRFDPSERGLAFASLRCRYIRHGND
jgi:pimeloyl-ACP methyl ester carboxylesterase